MKKAIIIDNDIRPAKRLTDLLKQYAPDNISCGGVYSSISEALPQLRQNRIQVVFADARLYLTNAASLANIPSDKCEVIFCSTAKNDAYKAFCHNAVDFLLKPYDVESIIRVLKKIGQKKPEDDIPENIKQLLGNVEQLKQYTPLHKIMVPTVNGFELLPVIDIIRCESHVNYTAIYIKDREKLVVAKTLKEFEEMLVGYNFFRVHNSHLINLAYIKTYHKGKGGYVKLSDGSVIYVSMRRKEEFMKKINAL